VVTGQRRGVGRPQTLSAPRETILAAAARLFAEKGYAQTSLQDLASAIGVSKAAIYHYYQSKQEIFEAIVVNLLERLYIAVEQRVAQTQGSVERIREALAAHAEFFQANYMEYVTLLHGFGGLRREVSPAELAMRDRYEGLIRGLVTAAEHDGKLTVDSPGHATRALLSMINWMTRWYRPDGEKMAADFARDYFDLLYHGIQKR
jgi:AcrR family transcriptional regulator